MSIVRELFGTLECGAEVYRYILRNERGMQVAILTLGGAIQQILVPDRNGVMDDVICGFDDLASYLACPGQHGALIGRFGNRIARGKFTLDGVEYTLATNNGVNHLHGGRVGFHHKLWSAVATDGEEPSLALSYVSPDGEEGYPGTVEYSVTYTLTDENGLKLEYFATTDKATPINLTNHVYFNLAGKGDVAEHIALVDADRFIPTDEGLIPTGEIPSVEGTAFDFREMKRIGDALESDDKDIEIGGGLDHCVVFTDRGEGFFKRVSVLSPERDVELQMYTDAPAVQFYSGNFLGNPDFPFRGGEAQFKRAAFCLESEAMPDSINHPNFTNTVLRPGEEYKTSTEYRFIAL